MSWVEDLFERIYETISLLNLDHYRAARMMQLSANEQGPMIAGDGVERPDCAMGGKDRLRVNQAIAQETPDFPLPLTERARARHNELCSIETLKDLAQSEGGKERFRTLIRKPFAVQTGENPEQTNMQMPPFMRNSNALPLTLAAWQYDLLMDWVNKQPSPLAAGQSASPQPLRSVLGNVRRQQLVDQFNRMNP